MLNSRTWKFLLKPCKPSTLSLISYVYKNVGYPNRPNIIVYSCLATTVLQKGRSSSTSGGLITYVDQSFQHDIISNINQHTLWEGLVLRIKGGGLPKGIIIRNIYIPPRMLKDEVKQFINEFTLLILSLEKHRLNINLAGDYNLNLLKIKNDELGNEFLT